MDNPYATGAPSYSTPVYTSHGAVDPQVIQVLQNTKPWVRLCSVIGFICTGFLLLFALVMLFGGAVMTTQNAAMPFAGFQFILGFIYAAMGILYLFPSIKLWRYGSAILRLLSTRSNADLVDALDQQRSFWKFVGIMILITLALYAVGIVIGIAFAAVAASNLPKP
jgi:hypothetical protein